MTTLRGRIEQLERRKTEASDRVQNEARLRALLHLYLRTAVGEDTTSWRDALARMPARVDVQNQGVGDVLRRLYIVSNIALRAKEGVDEYRELLRIADEAGLVTDNERRWLLYAGILPAE